MYKHFLPEEVLFVLNTLAGCGYSAHIVGGCVRDMLIGKTPTDYDITTSATPDEVKLAFSGYRTLDTGLKHGTVTLLYRGEPYEITTYRTEGEYTDNRHPDSVSFTRELALDLSRRDFTVNALCIDGEGRLTDMFSGVDDLKARTIRAVGVAAERFSEDALRILRAIRFSSVLDFTIENETAEAVRSHRHLLRDISGERIYSEIMKLLGGVGAYRVLAEFPEVITEVLPSLLTVKLPDKARFEAAGARERLVALYALGCEKNAAAALDSDLARLHTDSKIRKLGVAALENISADTDSSFGLLSLLFRLGEEGASFTAAVKELALGVPVSSSLRAAIFSGVPYKISDMAASGNTFSALGFAGAKIGVAMKNTLFAIMRGEIENNEEQIINYAKELKGKL